MSAAAAPEVAQARARRNLWVLVAAQIVLGSQLPVTFILGGLAGQMLAPNKCLATLPITLIITGGMLAAPLLSELMQRRGRGSASCSERSAAAWARRSAPWRWSRLLRALPAGSLLTGLYMSAQGFFRFAASDGASEDSRARAISYVMGGGPGLGGARAAARASDRGRAGAGALRRRLPGGGGAERGGGLALRLPRQPAPAPPAADGPRARRRRELIRTPRIAVAMICAMVSYALMNLVMTSTPLAMVGCGFTTPQAADVVSGHVLAMFGPAFFTGHLIARFGAERVIAAGLVVLAVAGAVALAGVSLAHFALAMILLGMGWNFGFIGATAMLAAAHTPEERGRVQGMNDFAVFGLVALASLASGGLMNCSGGDVVSGWTAVNLAMVPFLVAAGTALIWLAVASRPFGRSR